MNFLGTGILAALLAFLINRLGVRWLGIEGIVYFVPISEEMAKTFLPYFLNSSIFLTHLTFGVIEAFYDLFTSPEKGLAAGVISIIGHTIFGGGTTLVYFYSHNILLGILMGITLHIFWNGVVMKFFVTE